MDTQKIKIACVFEGDLQDGGGFQTQLSTVYALSQHLNYQIIAFTFSKKNYKVLKNLGLETVYVKQFKLDKLLRTLYVRHFFSIFKLKIKTKFEKKLEDSKIDLVYFLSPSFLALDLISHNYVFTIWDLCHRDLPEFPEVNNFREFENRELLYNYAPKKAIAVITDSELGRENCIRRYTLDADRVFAASFLPSLNISKTKFIDIREKYNIIGEYIFYPAQFWSHKNHIYIIDAISDLKREGVLLHVVFSGSDKGNLQYVLDYAKKMNVYDLVKYIGFAPNEEIFYLYKQSLALVMPSYFGPTNIPPLEAFAIGTPVIYSNLLGLREQVADAALLCDLRNPKSLVEHLKTLMNNPDKRIELIRKGQRRLNELQKISVLEVLIQIFDDYMIKLKCWKS